MPPFDHGNDCLSPEVLYGVAEYRRSDCSAAGTQRPSEPAVFQRMTKKYRFIIGLSPDEIPGYDFLRPTLDAEQVGLKETSDSPPRTAYAGAAVDQHWLLEPLVSFPRPA